MTWLDDLKQKHEQAMEQFKGKSFTCYSCGVEGVYDKDLVSGCVSIGEFGVLQGNTYTVSVRANFHCKDLKACQRRRKIKGS